MPSQQPQIWPKSDLNLPSTLLRIAVESEKEVNCSKDMNKILVKIYKIIWTIQIHISCLAPILKSWNFWKLAKSGPNELIFQVDSWERHFRVNQAQNKIPEIDSKPKKFWEYSIYISSNVKIFTIITTFNPIQILVFYFVHGSI